MQGHSLVLSLQSHRYGTERPLTLWKKFAVPVATNFQSNVYIYYMVCPSVSNMFSLIVSDTDAKVFFLQLPTGWNNKWYIYQQQYLRWRNFWPFIAYSSWWNILYEGDHSKGDLIDFVNKHRSDAPKTAVLLTPIYRMTMKHWDFYLFSYSKG